MKYFIVNIDTMMTIERLNDDIFKYIVMMIKNDDRFDIHDITKEQYDEYIVYRLLCDWNDGYDIAQHFGNSF